MDGTAVVEELELGSGEGLWKEMKCVCCQVVNVQGGSWTPKKKEEQEKKG